MTLGRFTPRVVPMIPHVAVVARTLEAAFRIGALLRTRIQMVALVNVLASFLVHQLVASLALAVESHLCVYTNVRTASIIDLTLALEALVGRFVRIVWTIRPLVAHFR